MLSSSAGLVTPVELFTPAEELALSGFLAGYSGLTREAYTLDLRQYAAWCTERSVALFAARRVDIEKLRSASRGLGSGDRSRIVPIGPNFRGKFAANALEDRSTIKAQVR
jgi:hypothetical protein